MIVTTISPIFSSFNDTIMTPGHVRSFSRAHEQQIRARSFSLHIALLLFAVNRADADAHLHSLTLVLGLLPRPAPRTMLRIVPAVSDMEHRSSPKT
jgi:hypothetical protein